MKLRDLFCTPEELRSHGVLSMNRRNVEFIALLNKRKDYPKADNKLLTKELAQEHGVAAPRLYTTFEYAGELHAFTERTDDLESFVIKPARGSGGEGVLVIDGRDGDSYIRGKKERYSFYELRYHCAGILHGLYSLGGRPDMVIVEEKVTFDTIFEGLTVDGVPDIRLIVVKGIPIMAMLRLPTMASRGRANLHQGAVGVGVDIATGKTTTAVAGSQNIKHHPDTGKELCGLQLPHWERLLEIAAKCYDFSNLGYLGVDIVYDMSKGPLLLEINARPGLAIQIANRMGLITPIKKVAQHLMNPDKGNVVSDRLEFCKHFHK